MKNLCVEASVYGEKLYRTFLDVIKKELDLMGVGDINPIQAFILMNINENVITIGEVLSRGYYIGSNASYNIKRMVTTGYINQTQSNYDKRASYLKLTDKGLNLYEKLERAINNHAKSLESRNSKDKIDLNNGIKFLKGIENFWKEILSKRL